MSEHHDYYIALAHSIAERSTCVRAKVGAVLVKDDRILSTGFNGAPKHLTHCTQESCVVVHAHCIRCVHAETNALLFADRVQGTIFYITHAPCLFCCQHLINAGVSMVYFDQNYNDDRITSLGYVNQQAYLEAAGVQCRRHRK